MKLWNHYHTPTTVEEAAEVLARYDGAARVVGGGTDLFLEIKDGRHPSVEALVDITHIAELTRISQSGDMVTLGAGVTHSRIVGDERLAARATCLVESCGVVGGPQVRNVATLGGNVAHALPAADGTTALMALDAEAEIWQGGQRRWVPMQDLFVGPGQSRLDPTRDLLLNLRFKLSAQREGSAFKRMMRPQGVALPILGCALWVQLADGGPIVEDVRICVSPVAPVPMRATSVESVLHGKKYTDALLEGAIQAARRDLLPRASKYRATSEYRVEMIDVLLRRAFPLAVKRASTGEAEPEGVGLQ